MKKCSACEGTASAAASSIVGRHMVLALLLVFVWNGPREELRIGAVFAGELDVWVYLEC